MSDAALPAIEMKTHRVECRSENDFHDDLMRKFRICALNKFPSAKERENNFDGEVKTPAEMSRKHSRASNVSLLLNNLCDDGDERSASV